MTQLNRIIHARGGKHPETDEEWAKYEADKAARRAKNVANAREILDRNEVNYRQLTQNPEVMFLVHCGATVIHYYPETGLWYMPIDGDQKFGCRNLVKYLKGECS